MIRVLSFGGGVQSTCLARMALAGELEPLDAMIFADPGAELPGTYRVVAEIEAAAQQADVRFLRVTNFRPGSSGNLYDDLMQLHTRARWSAPPLFVRDEKGDGFTRRQCTGDFKIDPILRAIRKLAGIGRRRKFTAPVVEQWLGISRDEAQRARVSDRPWLTLRYPLIELGMRRQDCAAWLIAHGHGVPPKSACFFCPYQSDARWRALREQHPEHWQRAIVLDNHLREHRQSMGLHGTPYLHAQRRPLAELTELTSQDDLFADECRGVCGV